MRKSIDEIRAHYDAMAAKRNRYHRRNRYYHRVMLRYYQRLVPPGSSILELGCGTGELIGRLQPSRGVGVDISGKMLEVARSNYPEIEFVCTDVEDFTTDQTFDYIIISGTLGTVREIQPFLMKLAAFGTHDSRFIIDFHSPLWNPIIRMGQRIGSKMPEIYNNWLSVDDIINFFSVSGYQVISRKFQMIFPKWIPLLTWFLNHLVGHLPIIRRFAITHVVTARIEMPPGDPEELSCSVVLTARDEEGNIEELIRRTPDMGKHTELIFVEGHSKDQTWEKIKEMMARYPEKDIRLLKQKGIGKKDAYRHGFDEARGDLIIILEADLTTPPEEAALFWETWASGKGEYLNGSRFIYKMEKSAMPLLNFMGNRFFGILFTHLLKQRFTDTLCGFKAISRRNYHKIREEIDYFGDFDPWGDFELIFGAVKKNLKVAEIPVHYMPRSYGAPKAYGRGFFSLMKHAWLLVKMSWIAFVKFVIN